MPGRSSARLRRSAHLAVYWRDAQIVIHNFATGDLVAGHPLTLATLDFFPTWRSRDDFVRSRPQDDARLLRRLLAALVKRRLLIVEGRDDAREQRMQAWEAWNPAAGFFHHATRDMPYASLADVEARATSPAPASVKPARRRATVRLPPPQRDGDFPRVLLGRRTWRAFANHSVPLDTLSTLLWFTGGVQRWEAVHDGGRAPLKTSPSGGALHPTELYVLALGVDGLPRGIYHYRQDTHALERVRRGAARREVSTFLPQQPWYEPAGAVIFFTTVFERSLWRYSYARAYRANLIEAGHYCQTFCLTATWLGLAPFCSMALADTPIERALGIDGIREAVVYAAGVGTRPTGVEWAPAPLDPSIPWLPTPARRPKRRAKR